MALPCWCLTRASTCPPSRSRGIDALFAAVADVLWRYRDRVLPFPTSRLRFREMTDADLPNIATLDIGGSRGPDGWIAWNRRNYEEHGFGLWIIETHGGRFVGD